MSLSDATLFCSDCKTLFVFTVQEQMFYASKNIVNPPNRCKTCRDKNKLQRSNEALERSTKRLEELPLSKWFTCKDCHRPFEFTIGEQQYYASRSLNDPSVCKECRAKYRPATSSSTGQARQLYNATCAGCGRETQVPFQPRQGRPVYCRNCYPAHRNS